MEESLEWLEATSCQPQSDARWANQFQCAHGLNQAKDCLSVTHSLRWPHIKSPQSYIRALCPSVWNAVNPLSLSSLCLWTGRFLCFVQFKLFCSRVTMVIVVYSSAVSCEATYLLTERKKIQMQSPESTGWLQNWPTHREMYSKVSLNFVFKYCCLLVPLQL